MEATFCVDCLEEALRMYGNPEIFNSDQGSQFTSDVALTQGQFDALVSFVFNVGAGNLMKSTLLRKLNAGDFAGADDEFLRWNKARGKVVEGLRRRRIAEMKVFVGVSVSTAPGISGDG
ncbi:lysozyme [Gammaproteobacteria bacterium]